MSLSFFVESVEFVRGFRARPNVSHVLYDFDGTLSLIREGWPEVMVPMFVEMLPKKEGESEAETKQLMFDDIMRLNGKQTIYQMIQLAERIKERGGQPKDPLWYKREYLRRLDERIANRVEGIREGRVNKEHFIVYEAHRLLEYFQRRGLKQYLASGTDEIYVKQEAELLGLSQYFGDRIYGAKDDYKSFSKKMVIDRILAENNISGEQLLAFGDGYVEIQNTKEAGGIAIALATDEAHNGQGRVDAWKRQRLLGVGADAVIPDYRDADVLVKAIFGQLDIPELKD